MMRPVLLFPLIYQLVLASEERYSRQVFTLGARAQGLLRSPETVMILDGHHGGLLYEVAKNVALMGVRNLLVVEQDDNVQGETNKDDLGKMIQTKGRLVEQLREMNPTISVSGVASRRSIWKRAQNYANAVYVMAEKPQNALEMAELARKHKIKCIIAESRGVFGRIMCDFGESHTVVDPDGEVPLLVPLDKIVPDQHNDTRVMIHSVEGEKHDVSKGDIVEFRAASGDVVSSCTVQEVLTPFQFRATIHSTTFLRDVQASTAFQRIKTPVELKYQPLRKVLQSLKNDDDVFTPCDLSKSFDTQRRQTIMEAFAAIPMCETQEEFERMVRTSVSRVDESLLTNFWRGRAVKFAPMQAILGAIVAQEAIKAITGVYTPIHQILLYDVDEVLPEDGLLIESDELSTQGLRNLLGKSVVDQLENAKVFVVGAGAIGCELLKNLATMGIGAGSRGKVIVTDMDTIEASNLSRQLLFRESDLGKFKSIAAKEAIERLQPSMNLEAHSSKVGEGSNTPFDETFWSELDVVLNALDNVEARLYMDAQCVANRKALIDAGTMGPKGNVQVVVPFLSESYASSADPPEPAIPVCTLKNFPYAISHTIQWGKEMFEDLFQRRPFHGNKLLDEVKTMNPEKVIRTIYKENGRERAAEIVNGASQDIEAAIQASNHSETKSESIQWAAKLAHRMFYEAAENLLKEHPVDSNDEDGEPFWSGTRRAPKCLKFEEKPVTTEEEAINQNLVDFVLFAAKLRLEVLTGEKFDDEWLGREEAARALLAASSVLTSKDSNSGDAFTPKDFMKTLSNLKNYKKRLFQIDFEKDDESNGHVAFITASSNLRAIAYSIPPVTVDETRRIAGKIIPAMVTTTALVSGLSCVELIKVAQTKDLHKHRNAFVNLALPFFAFTSPVPAETLPGLQGRSYTLWDRIIIREGPISSSKGGISLKHVLKTVKQKVADDVAAVDVASISYGPFMIYTNFLHDGDLNILEQKLWSLLEETLKDENESSYDPNAPYIDLDVVVEEDDGTVAIELPPVRIYRFPNSG